MFSNGITAIDGPCAEESGADDPPARLIANAPPTTAIATPTAMAVHSPTRLRDGVVAPTVAYCAVGAIPPLGVVAEASIVIASLALCTRSAGRFSRRRITSAASGAGMFGRRLSTGSGASVACAASIACGDRWLNTWNPVSISYAIAPTA